MRQAQKSKEKDKIAIVLMLCFCVIALTSIFTVKANIDKINDNAPDMQVSENAKTETTKNNNDLPITQAETSSDMDESAQAATNVPTVDSLEGAGSQSDFVMPVNHEGVKLRNAFAMDSLIYSVTLDQYMTHCGIDVEAPEDSQVVAVAEGTVTSVYKDDRFGTSIEITHPNNLITIYSNLSTDEMVEVGDVVNKGQIIGGVGSSGLFESLEPAHLHFEVIKDGAYVDPCNYITF